MSCTYTHGKSTENTYAYTPTQIVETQEVSMVSKIIHAAQGLKAFPCAISLGVIYILSLLFAMGVVCCSRFSCTRKPV